MSNRKTTSSDVIQSTRILTEFANEESKKLIIENILKQHQLTEQFVNEFINYITPEIFSNSAFLSPELVNNFPELFNEDLYLKNISTNIRIANIGMLAKYSDTINVSEDKIPESEFISCIRNATPEELNNEEYISGIIGKFGDEVDSLILRRIKNQDTKDKIILLLQLSDKQEISKASLKYISNESKEELLGKENVPVKEFIKVISESKDLGWVLKLINSVISNELTLERSASVLDNDVIELFSKLPEDIIVKFFKLKKYMPNVFSYAVLSWVIKFKDFTEENYINSIETFKSAGLYFELRKIAKNRGFLELSKLL